jgi:CTP synthase (UTP-ammonia lyase)
LKVGEIDGETWWSNYEVVIDWKPTPMQFAVPYHPEYQSMKKNPHPIIKEFIEYASAS